MTDSMGTLPLPPPPPPPPPPALDPAFVADATVSATDVSVWFGQKVALSDLSCSFGAGVTGLLGPNGAGKTTLMRAITGLIPVNQGRVVVDGTLPAPGPFGVRTAGARARGRGGAAGLTPRQLCTYVADLHGITDRRIVDWAIETVQMESAADRSMDGFSKGMRQRSKVAAALVKNPLVLVLDEPLNGADPIQRAASDRAVPTARRRGPHGDRQLARAARGRGDGGAGDRDRPRAAWPRPAGTAPSATPWTTCPRQLLVRAPGGRRLAADVGRARGGGRGAARRRRPHRVHHPSQGRRRASSGPPVTSACTSSRCARSTTRSRACSGSWCGERHRHPTDAVRALRCHRALHAPVGAAREAVDRRRSSRPPRRCCSG